MVQWIYSKGLMSKSDNSAKPSKEAAQPTKVRPRQLGSSFTQVKGAYPEVVNSVVEKQFSLKNENEALLWVIYETYGRRSFQ